MGISGTTHTDAEAKTKVHDLIKDARIAMLATKGADGAWHGRPMGTARVTLDGEIWFLAGKASGKIEEIDAEPEVLVTYSDEGNQHYVSLTGHAAVVRDRARIHDLWSEADRVWFPKGKDDPDIAAIRVDIATADYWDAPSSTMIYLYGYAKAVATGRRPHLGAERGNVAYI